MANTLGIIIPDNTTPKVGDLATPTGSSISPTGNQGAQPNINSSNINTSGGAFSSSSEGISQMVFDLLKNISINGVYPTVAGGNIDYSLSTESRASDQWAMQNWQGQYTPTNNQVDALIQQAITKSGIISGDSGQNPQKSNIDIANSSSTVANSNVDIAKSSSTVANSNVDIANSSSTVANSNVDIAKSSSTVANSNVDIANSSSTVANSNVDIAKSSSTVANSNVDIAKSSSTVANSNVEVANSYSTVANSNVDTAKASPNLIADSKTEGLRSQIPVLNDAVQKASDPVVNHRRSNSLSETASQQSSMTQLLCTKGSTGNAYLVHVHDSHATVIDVESMRNDDPYISTNAGPLTPADYYVGGLPVDFYCYHNGKYGYITLTAGAKFKELGT